MSTVYSHLGQYIDREFEKDLYAYFQSRLPEDIFDAHIHVCPRGPYSKTHVDVDEDVAYWRGFMEEIVGKGRMKGALMLPHLFPRKRSTLATIMPSDRRQTTRAARRRLSSQRIRTPKKLNSTYWQTRSSPR